MEANLIAVILIIFGFMQIVLFFKIWGMTDDIKAMKKHFISNIANDAKAAYLNGSKEIAKEILDNDLFDKLKNSAKLEPKWHSHLDTYNKIIQEYVEYYKNIHLDMPDIEQWKDREFVLTLIEKQ